MLLSRMLTAAVACAALANGAGAQEMLSTLSLDMPAAKASDTVLAAADSTPPQPAASPATIPPASPAPAPAVAAAAAPAPATTAPIPATTAPIPATASPTPATAAPMPAAQTLSQAQLDQLVAPIALYPDPLLSQILMASTYPLEVVEAARWVAEPATKALSGEALTNAAKQQNWDPSVTGLVAFPRVLADLSNKLSWTQELGNAFLAQQSDVMGAVQHLRHVAMAAGTLKQTPQCHCVIKTSGATISILPAAPQMVCLPVYNPRVAYGVWPEPMYPPYAFPVPAGFVFAPDFAIGFYPAVELAAFGPFWGWGRPDWDHGYIGVDSARYALTGASRPAFAGGVWVHDPAHRGAVAYTNAAVSARFGAARTAAVTAAGRASFSRSAAMAPAGAARAAIAANHGSAVFHGAGTALHAGASGFRPAFHNAAAFHGGAAFHGAGGFHGGAAFHARGAFHGGGFAHASAARAAPAHIGGGGHGGGGHGGGHHR